MKIVRGSVCVCVRRVLTRIRHTSVHRPHIVITLLQRAITPRDRYRGAARLAAGVRLPHEARDGHRGRSLFRATELDTSPQGDRDHLDVRDGGNGDRLRGAIDVGPEIATSDIDPNDLARPPQAPTPQGQRLQRRAAARRMVYKYPVEDRRTDAARQVRRAWMDDRIRRCCAAPVLSP